jgi:formylglycine-generating enzyme required for sulfatase activity
MGRCGDAGAGCSDEWNGGGEEVPEHDATVSDFYLDTFAVTVGRFRKFVEQYDGTAPAQDAGAHPLIADSGWQNAWNSELPSTETGLTSNLKCSYIGGQTWTDTAGANEQYPINCVSWYEAFAFCIWDGGRLPTEAEWEYAAAGGSENRLYPWGPEAPDGTPERANMHNTANSSFIDVGSYPDGAGRYGQHDLAGSTWEWVLDWYEGEWYSGDGNTCNNCSNLNNPFYRVARGGSFGNNALYLRSAYRFYDSPSNRAGSIGFRCARTP